MYETNLSSPVFLISVPKSGTHLLKNILTSILGGPLVIHPVPVLTMEPFRKEFIDGRSKLSNVIYCDHIAYSEDLAEKISHYPKLILIRDPRDNAISLTHFLPKSNISKFCSKTQLEEDWNKRTWDEKLSAVIFGTHIGNYHLESIMDYFLKFAIKWAGEPNTLFVRYEDLIGSQHGDDCRLINAVKSIMKFIGVEFDQNTLARKIKSGKEPVKSVTFRSGMKGKWQQEFTSTHIKQLKIAARDLISSLGYEKSENWDIEKVSESSEQIYCNINIPALTKLVNKKISLEWDRYLRLRGEFINTVAKKSVQSQAYKPHPFDEWALYVYSTRNKFENAFYVLEHYLLPFRPKEPSWNLYYALHLCIMKKKFREAIHYFDIALENGADEFHTVYYRALALKHLGEVEDARIGLQQAVKLKPEHKAASKELKEIEKK